MKINKTRWNSAAQYLELKLNRSPAAGCASLQSKLEISSSLLRALRIQSKRTKLSAN